MTARRSEKRQTLTRDRVIEVAAELVQAEGVEAVTLRRLAGDFGVTPMALYRHVKDKDDILSSVLSRLLAQALFPATSSNWQRYLRAYSDGLRRLLLENGGLVRVILKPKALEAAALDAMEVALSTLRESGFSSSQAARLFTSINSFTIGSALWQAMRSESEAANLTSGQPANRYWDMDFETLDRDRYPELSRHKRSLEARNFDSEFRDGIDRLLNEAAQNLA